jgi:hypothetical protein
VGCSAGDVKGWTFFVCEEGWVRQKMRLEKEKTSLWAEGKIVFLLHNANTNPNPFIKQGLLFVLY